MTSREFFQRATGGKKDFVRSFVGVLRSRRLPFCVIGGLAVNAYAEPVVSLDLDLVVAAEGIEDLVDLLSKKFRVERFENSVNVSLPGSDLRIQIQTDPRYQDFIRRSKKLRTLGYLLPVANIRDVLQGKIWAALDQSRRASKRQKDLADILRLIETDPGLKSLIPHELAGRLL
ncbi:MAG: hypothetical protein PHQ23_11060 [Candidatus Wallbacteria bacterium]|nr:hypothetical protein [Candidatus Wallbacteria bacterium]